MNGKITSERGARSLNAREYLDVVLRDDEDEIAYFIRFTPEGIQVWRGDEVLLSTI